MAGEKRRRGKPEPKQEDAELYIKAVEDTFRDEMEKFNGFLQVMSILTDRSVFWAELPGVVEQVKNLFEGHRDLILGFNTFLPDRYEIALPLEDEEPPQENSVTFEEMVNLSNKIQTRFQGKNHVIESYKHIMSEFRNKTFDETYDEIKALFRGHEDLVKDFARSLRASRESDHDRPVSKVDKDQCRLGKIKKNRGKDTERRGIDKSTRGIKIKESCSRQSRQPEPLKLVDTDKERDDVARIERDRGNRVRGRKGKVVEDVASPRTSRYPKRDKYAGKGISQLNLSNSESCTPSYRRLPADYPIPRASGREDLSDKVRNTLNDNWVSVPSGSGSGRGRGRYKKVKKTQHEEIMLKCEDTRYEQDMLIETTNKVKELFGKIDNGTIKTDVPIRIEDHLSAMDLRCIKQLYGVAVLDGLTKNVLVNLPVLLNRLLEKQKELKMKVSELEIVRDKIYAENHQKSLDRPSGQFPRRHSGTKEKK